MNMSYGKCILSGKFLLSLGLMSAGLIRSSCGQSDKAATDASKTEEAPAAEEKVLKI